MKIHCYASQPHYLHHLYAIWLQLPDGLKGHVGTGAPLGWPMVEPDDVVMVAGYSDVLATPNNRIIYVEHGAGQRYTGITREHAQHYHGGEHPGRVIAYIAPRQEIIDRWGRPGYAAGAPICDQYELFGEPNVIAFTWHYEGRNVCPEASSAWAHYVESMPTIIEALKAHGWEVLGHQHPRWGANSKISRAWANWDVREVDVDEVRRRASVLVADNTSLAYEMLYLNRAVISLSAPWYRRDVEHGLRFWSHIPGLHVASPEHLLAVIRRDGIQSEGTIADWSTNRQVYGRERSDGQDGFRAAAWITQFAATL